MKRLTLILLLLAASPAWATTFTEFYVQPTGNNLNSGHTPDDAATFTAASGYWTNNTTSGVFYKADLNPESTVSNGAWAALSYDGDTTNLFVGLVTARSDSTDTITLSLTAKGGTAPASNEYGTNTITVGGAWKGPNNDIAYTAASDARMHFPFNFAAATMTNTAGNLTRVNFKAGTYNVTNAMTHALAGPIVFAGYTTVPGDGGKAVFDGQPAATAGYQLFSVSGNWQQFWDLIWTNNGNSGTSTLVSDSGNVESVYVRCGFYSSRGYGFAGASGLRLSCEASDCGKGNSAVAGFTGGTFINCVARQNRGTSCQGFNLGAADVVMDSLSWSNASHGFVLAGSSISALKSSVAYGNGGSGILIGQVSCAFSIINCAVFANSAYGIANNQSSFGNHIDINTLFGIGTQANASGKYQYEDAVGVRRGTVSLGAIEHTTDTTPWVSPSGGNFTMASSTTAKAAGWGTYMSWSTNGLTVGYPDLGAAQAASTNAGSSVTRRAVFLQ